MDARGACSSYITAGIDTEQGKTIKIGFEWSGLTEQMKEARLQRGAGDTTGAGDWKRDLGQSVGESSSVPLKSIFIFLLKRKHAAFHRDIESPFPLLFF